MQFPYKLGLIVQWNFSGVPWFLFIACDKTIQETDQKELACFLFCQEKNLIGNPEAQDLV